MPGPTRRALADTLPVSSEERLPRFYKKENRLRRLGAFLGRVAIRLPSWAWSEAPE